MTVSAPTRRAFLDTITMAGAALPSSSAAQSRPNSVPTGIDFRPDYEQTPRHLLMMIEAHSRRCGSHLGHIRYVDDRLLHCINGTALEFRPTEA